MTLLADPTVQQTASGMELELKWSDDETMVTLYIHRPNSPKIHGRSIKIRMSTVQLDELREFIASNIR